jgi:hypothetical protein
MTTGVSEDFLEDGVFPVHEPDSHEKDSGYWFGRFR